MSGNPPSQRFQVRETLADNELETVQRVFDQLLQREALLKTTGPAVRKSLASASERRRVLREARALARVQHEGVIRILDVLDTANGVQLLLEPVAGESLGDRLARTGSLPPEDVRTLGIQVAAALAAVHHAGFLHRGIAEHAILMRAGGGVCLVGFSFAKAGSHEVTMSSLDYRLARAHAETPAAPPQPLAGLPPYPSPEQLAGQPADPRSDLFALGCVLYRCLAGRALSPAELQPGVLPELPAQVPADLAEAVAACLARSPMRRPQTALALVELLSARSKAPAAGRPLARRVGAWWIAAAVLLLVAGVLWSFSGGTLATPRVPAPDPQVDRTKQPFSDHYGDSRAVVIGIGPGYAVNGYAPLPNAERDADAIAALLPSLGFRTVKPLLGKEADRVSIKKAVANAVLDTQHDDRLLIYYAGHGVRHPIHPDKGCIVPSDARADDKTGSQLLAFEELTSDLFLAPPKHILVALDCCYSGRATILRSEEITTRKAFAECLRHRVRMVMASSGSDQRAPDSIDGKDHSPFALAFLSTLQATDVEAVRARDLFDHIRNRLRDARSLAQPRLLDQSEGDGDFVFYLPRKG